MSNGAPPLNPQRAQIMGDTSPHHTPYIYTLIPLFLPQFDQQMGHHNIPISLPVSVARQRAHTLGLRGFCVVLTCKNRANKCLIRKACTDGEMRH